MHYTIELLLNGDNEVAFYFLKARTRWKAFYEEKQDASVEEWAKWITRAQYDFEQDCGSLKMAKEIMPWAAIASLYTTQYGFRDDDRRIAIKVVEAFMRSHVSGEIKSGIAKAAKSYHLDGVPELEGYF